MNFEKINEPYSKQEKIYLNNASVSIIPKSTIKEMNDFLINYNSIGPDSQESELVIKNLFRDTREIVSKLINCKRDEITLTQSTTDGINFVASGLSYNSNSNIIIRGKEHEHHSNYYPWLKAGRSAEIKNLRIDDDGFFKNNELKEKINKNTKIVSLSHALYNTGAILPVEEVGEILENESSTFFVDAAQTVGCIDNVDVRKIKCDFMSFNGSKWLCGPMGTGVFYCNKDSDEFLEPVHIGGESGIIYDKNKIAYKNGPDRFQTGFRNYVGIVGMKSSINFILEIGLSKIRNHIRSLSTKLRDELKKNLNVKLYGPDDSNLRTSIVSFSIKNKEPDFIIKKLEKRGIVLAKREVGTQKIVRASPHFFNTDEQICKVVKEINEI